MITPRCPLCSRTIRAGLKVKFGQRLHCPACDGVLEVVGLNPIKLDWLYFDQNTNEDEKNKNEGIEMVECPICTHEFKTPSKLRLGQCVCCPSCEVELEVVWLNPIEFSWPIGAGLQLYRDDQPDDIDYVIRKE